MTHDDQNERSTVLLLKDLIANQHSLYEDLQAVVEKLDYLETRIEAVLAEVNDTTSVKVETPPSVVKSDGKDVGEMHDENEDESYNVIDLSGGDEIGESESASAEEISGDGTYEAAEALVIESGKATQAFLQHELHVTAARAKELLQQLEEEGVIGPLRIGKSRKVKISMMGE